MVHALERLLTLTSAVLGQTVLHSLDGHGRLGDEASASGNNGIGTGLGGRVDSGGAKTTVDLDVQVGVLLAKSLNLGHHILHKALSTEARLDGHDQDEVHVINVLENGLDRGLRLDGDTNLHAGLLDGGDQSRNTTLGHVGLDVEGEHVNTGISHVGDELNRVAHHKVSIEEGGAALPQALNDGGTPGQVGDEVAVHDVNVQDISAGIQNTLRVGGQVGQVSSEQRRGNDRRGSLVGLTVGGLPHLSLLVGGGGRHSNTRSGCDELVDGEGDGGNHGTNGGGGGEGGGRGGGSELLSVHDVTGAGSLGILRGLGISTGNGTTNLAGLGGVSGHGPHGLRGSLDSI